MHHAAEAPGSVCVWGGGGVEKTRCMYRDAETAGGAGWGKSGAGCIMLLRLQGGDMLRQHSPDTHPCPDPLPPHLWRPPQS